LQSAIYDIEANTETILPDIPNSVRVTNPFDGTITLLPLAPPLYIPEVLVCGGTNTSDLIPSLNLSSQNPASDQCSRITLTPAGIEKGWEVERMLEGRTMPEMILLPTGQVLIINGAQTGYAAIASVGDIQGNSNADHAAYVVPCSSKHRDNFSSSVSHPRYMTLLLLSVTALATKVCRPPTLPVCIILP
jgi:hypothetical protein